MLNKWIVFYLAGLATAIGLAIGAALALADGPYDGLTGSTGSTREACECRTTCLNGGDADGHVINRQCICDPSPRGTNCRTSTDCIGRGGECVSGVCRYPDGGPK